MKQSITKTVRPFGAYMLIKPVFNGIEQMEGIILPDNIKEDPVEYEVISLGTDKFVVEVGNVILPTKYDSGMEIIIDGHKHKLITEADVLAIVRL